MVYLFSGYLCISIYCAGFPIPYNKHPKLFIIKIHIEKGLFFIISQFWKQTQENAMKPKTHAKSAIWDGRKMKLQLPLGCM